MKKLFYCLLLGTIVSPTILIKNNAIANPFLEIDCFTSTIESDGSSFDAAGRASTQQAVSLAELTGQTYRHGYTLIKFTYPIGKTKIQKLIKMY